MTVRKEKFLGLELFTGTPDELLALHEEGEQSIHTMARCTNLVGVEPYPALAKRRRRMPCEGCREICWYDPESIVNPHATFLCRECSTDWREAAGGEEEESMVPQHILDELRGEREWSLRQPGDV